jgi:hypothetical protein
MEKINVVILIINAVTAVMKAVSMVMNTLGTPAAKLLMRSRDKKSIQKRGVRATPIAKPEPRRVTGRRTELPSKVMLRFLQGVGIVEILFFVFELSKGFRVSHLAKSDLFYVSLLPLSAVLLSLMIFFIQLDIRRGKFKTQINRRATAR